MGRVKDTLGNADNYTVKENDAAELHAECEVKYAAHITITGAILQRTNKVKSVAKGEGCEMQVVSNFGGWEHSDREDFKKQVDESLVKLKARPSRAL